MRLSPLLCLVISAVTFFTSCGGRDGGSPHIDRTAITGDWEFVMTPADIHVQRFALAGYGTVSGEAGSGTLHAFDSTCYDPSTSIAFTSTMSGGNTVITSANVDGQVITITLPVGMFSYAGTYRVTGGCGDGTQGNVIAMLFPAVVSGHYNAYFDQSNSATGTATFEQAASPDTHGVYPVTGDIDMAGSPCSRSAHIDLGFVAGAHVLLQLTTLDSDDTAGSVRFVGSITGTPSAGYSLSGTYTYLSGSCAGRTGTAAFEKP